MVPFSYQGYVPIHTPGYIFGTRYKESTEEALEKFLQTNKKERSDQQDLARTAALAPTLRKRFDFHDPAVYPDLNPMYSKNYRTCKFQQNSYYDFSIVCVLERVLPEVNIRDSSIKDIIASIQAASE